mmetsp:Transcript_10837/g.30245  ORF Transcript_10837/g.30245 Transcript_10837/m.30245 type:complete len:203 (-) Transcript_10837:2368-2976(-)
MPWDPRDDGHKQHAIEECAFDPPYQQERRDDPACDAEPHCRRLHLLAFAHMHRRGRKVDVDERKLNVTGILSQTDEPANFCCITRKPIYSPRVVRRVEHILHRIPWTASEPGQRCRIERNGPERPQSRVREQQTHTHRPGERNASRHVLHHRSAHSCQRQNDEYPTLQEYGHQRLLVRQNVLADNLIGKIHIDTDPGRQSHG